jgi:hypothetical protein
VLIVKKVEKKNDGSYATNWELTEDQMGFLLTFAINSLLAEGLVQIQENTSDIKDLLSGLDDLTEQ